MMDIPEAPCDRWDLVTFHERVGTMANIKDILARRNDLDSFLVHLTKDVPRQGAEEKVTARENLISIIRDNRIEARSNFGFAKTLAEKGSINKWSQKAVCFTETPLEHLHLLVEKIEGRRHHFTSYGIVITKKFARENNVNPVWYVENNSDLGKVRQTFFNNILRRYETEPELGSFFQITPYIETMGHVQNLNLNTEFDIEFWWEKEWRKIGDFDLPAKYIVLCPEDDIKEIQALAMKENDLNWWPCIDPVWSMEQIIASLAGFDLDEEVNINISLRKSNQSMEN